MGLFVWSYQRFLAFVKTCCGPEGNCYMTTKLSARSSLPEGFWQVFFRVFMTFRWKTSHLFLYFYSNKPICISTFTNCYLVWTLKCTKCWLRLVQQFTCVANYLMTLSENNLNVEQMERFKNPVGLSDKWSLCRSNLLPFFNALSVWPCFRHSITYNLFHHSAFITMLIKMFVFLHCISAEPQVVVEFTFYICVFIISSLSLSFLLPNLPLTLVESDFSLTQS